MKIYTLNTPENHDPALFATRDEAASVARFVHENRRGRMGRGRLIKAYPYRTRLAGSPWAVAVQFVGVLYECGRTRRRLKASGFVVSTD